MSSKFHPLPDPNLAMEFNILSRIYTNTVKCSYLSLNRQETQEDINQAYQEMVDFVNQNPKYSHLQRLLPARPYQISD